MHAQLDINLFFLADCNLIDIIFIGINIWHGISTVKYIFFFKRLQKSLTYKMIYYKKHINTYLYFKPDIWNEKT